MKVLVVFESMYGNTAAVARAIAEGLRPTVDVVTALGVNEVDPRDVSGYDLVVVGGPTHAHGMSRTTTRMTAIEDAKRTYDEPTKGEGLREWIEGLHGDGRAAAAFDTRIDAPAALTGAASKGIAKRLAGRAFKVVVDRESFLVTKQNMLVDGELERAEAWGARLAAHPVTV
jgi:flavodoxin